MRLEQSDAELFYQLWFPLLDFVNKKYHVCPETETIDQRQGVDASDAKAIADYLWSHIEVIEEYLAIAELPKEYAQIVAGWKQCKPGRYILERHLKNVPPAARQAAVLAISVKKKTRYMCWTVHSQIQAENTVHTPVAALFLYRATHHLVALLTDVFKMYIL